MVRGSPQGERGGRGGQALTHSLALHGVPDIAVEVVVARKEQAAAEGEGHGCDAADDALVGVGGQLLVRPQVKQAAGGVVRARADGLSIGEELRVQVARGQDSDLGSPLPFLPSPCSCPGDSRPSCFPQPPRPPPPSLPPPARSLFTTDVCHMPAAAGLPTPFPAPQYFHVAGESMGLREGGQRAQGHMVRRAEAVPDANDYSRLDQCVSTGPSTHAYPESHHEEMSHNPMEGKSTENWLVLFKNVNVTKDRERAQTVPV